MAIDRKADYLIKNASGLEVEVPGQVLLERALANEADTIDGIPLREYVRQNVDAQDSVAQAHEQGVDLSIGPLSKEDANARIYAIREAEAQVAVAQAVSNPEDDNLSDAGVLDDRDSNQDNIPDRVEIDAAKQGVAGASEEPAKDAE